MNCLKALSSNTVVFWALRFWTLTYNYGWIHPMSDASPEVHQIEMRILNTKAAACISHWMWSDFSRRMSMWVSCQELFLGSFSSIYRDRITALVQKQINVAHLITLSKQWENYLLFIYLFRCGGHHKQYSGLTPVKKLMITPGGLRNHMGA